MNTPQIKHGWWTTAKAGDKVVCVGLPKGEIYGRVVPIPDLVISNIYTVSELAEHRGDIYVSLSEIDAIFQSGRAHFLAKYFRPVTPKSTDKAMKAIREHLKTRELAE